MVMAVVGEGADVIAARKHTFAWGAWLKSTDSEDSEQTEVKEDDPQEPVVHADRQADSERGVKPLAEINVSTT